MPQIFISYKYSWMDKIELRKDLEFISSHFKSIWYSTYIVTKELQKWQEVEFTQEMIEESLEELKKSEIFFCYIKTQEKSEWMLVEFGYAKAINKKIVVFCKKWIETFFVKKLANTYIEYEDLNEITNITNF